MHFFESELERLREQNLFRNLQTVHHVSGPTIEIESGVRLLNFCSNNYLGLAHASSAIQQAKIALDAVGMGATASRLLAGDHVHHQTLENDLAHFVGTQAACVFSSGYATNCGAIPALVGREDVIFSDALNHASMIDGAKLSGAKILIYPHRNMAVLERLLKEHAAHFRRRMILTEGVFSMEGSCAPLPRLNQLALQHSTLLYVDDAHGLGVLGQGGQGIFAHHQVPIDEDHIVYVGTLGKALGAMGGFVAGKKILKEFLINSVRSFIFATALPPCVCAFVSSVLKNLQSNPAPIKKMRENCEYFMDATSHWNGFSRRENQPIPIQPFWIGDEKIALRVAQTLFEQGIFARAIRPPTVPKNEARIRLTLSAHHDQSHIQQLISALGSFAQ